MKKILLISSLLLVALTGCAKSSSDESSTEPQTKNAALGDRYTDAEAKSVFSSASVCADLEVRKLTASQVNGTGTGTVKLSMVDIRSDLQTCNLIGELSYEQLSQVSGDWFIGLTESSAQSLSIKVIKTLTKDQLTGLLKNVFLTADQTKVATQSLTNLG